MANLAGGVNIVYNFHSPWRLNIILGYWVFEGSVSLCVKLGPHVRLFLWVGFRQYDSWMRGSVNSFSPGKFARLALLSSADHFLVFPYLSKRAGSGPGWVALLAGASSRYAKVSDSTSGPVRAHTRVNPRMHPYVEQQVHGSLSLINSKKYQELDSNARCWTWNLSVSCGTTFPHHRESFACSASEGSI